MRQQRSRNKTQSFSQLVAVTSFSGAVVLFGASAPRYMAYRCRWASYAAQSCALGLWAALVPGTANASASRAFDMITHIASGGRTGGAVVLFGASAPRYMVYRCRWASYAAQICALGLWAALVAGTANTGASRAFDMITHIARACLP